MVKDIAIVTMADQ